MSADGKAGLAGRRPVQITGSAARNHVHQMRATSDAVLTGIGTVLSDDPLLTCRLPGMADRSPVRVVLDSRLRLPLDGRLVATAREVPLWVVTGEGAPQDREQALRAHGVEVLRVRSVDGKLDLGAVLQTLGGARHHPADDRGGPIVSAAFVNADLVDEAVVFRSPNAIGPDGIDALEGLPLERIDRVAAAGHEGHGNGREPIRSNASAARRLSRCRTIPSTVIRTTILMIMAIRTIMIMVMTMTIMTTIMHHTIIVTIGIPTAMSPTGSRAMRVAWPSACRSSRR